MKKHKSHRTYFSLTARFLSGYVKKTNLAVNHFSLTANIFMISLSLEKNHKANPGLGKCRSLYVSIEEKNPYRMIASLNEPIEALKKEKKRSTEAKFIYTPQIHDVAILTTSFYDI